MFKEQEIAMEIGNAVLSKFIGPVIEKLKNEKDEEVIKLLRLEYAEAYIKTHKEIDSYRITGIEFREEDNSVIIVLARPGVFIGYKGQNIDRITQYLQKQMPGLKIRIKEDKVQDYLYPQDWSGYDDDEDDFDDDGCRKDCIGNCHQCPDY